MPTARPILFSTGTPVKLPSSAATTNATLFRAGPANLFEITITNKTAAVVYVKLYDKATAPTVGTDIPVLTIPVGITAATLPPVAMSFGALGKSFTLGLAYAITGAVTDADATAVATGVTVSATVV